MARRETIRGIAILAVAFGVVALGAATAMGAFGGRPWDFGPVASAGTLPSSGTGNASPSASASSPADEVDGDEGISLPAEWLAPADGRIQIYPDSPSILPGQPLLLHASTDAGLYSLAITRDGAAPQVVFRQTGYVAADYRGELTIDQTMLTIRANWPVSATVPTDGWRPGVYTVAAKDSRGRTSSTLFVVRSPVIHRTDMLYVLPVMTYQAYNNWGGSDLYTSPRAFRVSFDRPYSASAGLGQYPAYDRPILAWAERRGYPLAFTTDYDLSMSPPATAPAVLLLPQHTEYVTALLYDWVDQHVNGTGDMNVALFGANSFYWQVRMAPNPQGPSRPSDIVAYKDCTLDPITVTNPALTTCRWRDAPINRPETTLFGAMYSGIVANGHIGYDLTVSGDMPDWAIAGTGWKPGTVLGAMVGGEADMTATDQGGIAIATGTAPYRDTGLMLDAAMTVRVSPAGAHVFDAGTFLMGAALGGKVSLGVPQGSFERFTVNVLHWLGMSPGQVLPPASPSPSPSPTPSPSPSPSPSQSPSPSPSHTPAPSPTPTSTASAGPLPTPRPTPPPRFGPPRQL